LGDKVGLKALGRYTSHTVYRFTEHTVSASATTNSIEPATREQSANDDSSEPACSSSDDKPPQSIQIDLTLDAPDTNPPVTGWLDVQLARIAELARLDQVTLSLVVVEDEQMDRMHQQYKQTAGTTDALTFDLRDDPDGPQVEGEVIICCDVAQRQAVTRGHDTRLELLLYALHGLLHLCGYDDLTEQDAAKMHQREDELLTLAGFGPVFGREQEIEPR